MDDTLPRLLIFYFRNHSIDYHYDYPMRTDHCSRTGDFDDPFSASTTLETFSYRNTNRPSEWPTEQPIPASALHERKFFTVYASRRGLESHALGQTITQPLL